MSTDGALRNPDRTAQGIAIILASVTAMAFADAVVKLVSAEMSIWQVFVMRSLFALPCLVGLAYAGGGRLRARSPRWVIMRSLLILFCWMAFYTALPLLNLALAAVAVYTNPILTTLFSALFLRERVTTRQWCGVLLGFLGVAVVLKPGSDSFSWAILLPLIAATLYSLAAVVTRSKCRDEDAGAMAISLHLSFLVAGVCGTLVLLALGLDVAVVARHPFLFGDWGIMGGQAWGTMALLGVLSALFFLGVAKAYQIAPPQIIGVFDYGYLVSAAIWGLIFFGERPDRFTLLGMALIIAAGLLVATPKRRR